ncbi:MAG: PPOX class F420-dependent oxidoreductase [Actinomycetota bacterium]|nr:PPOX class F420-dependent oxidoreductase [Actinomycetota bacterium]
MPLDDKARKLIQGKNFGHLATISWDGSPHVTPVWIDLDNDQVLVNTSVGRVKERNVRRDDRVAISIADQEDPYDYVQIRGHVAEVTRDGADEHIDKMAKKYTGEDKYPWRSPDEKRVVLRIKPE